MDHIVTAFVHNVQDVLCNRWTWRVAVFIFMLFVGNFLAQAIFDAGVEYGRNSCGVTTLYKSN